MKKFLKTRSITVGRPADYSEAQKEAKVPDEKQLCPRREEGPVFTETTEDSWRHNRWGGDPASFKWPKELGEPPRSCSFCGGVHVTDVIKMIVDGWVIEPSDKSYKWYIEPPKGLSIIPPVKLYGQHATPEELIVLNGLLKEQRKVKI